MKRLTRVTWRLARRFVIGKNIIPTRWLADHNVCCSLFLLVSHASCFCCPPPAVVNQETFEYLLPLAYQWAKSQEDYVIAGGISLGPRHLEDAARAGIHEVSRL